MKRLKRKKRTIPEVLSRQDQIRFLTALPSRTLLQRRNLAMVRLMLNAGLRSQEVCDIRLGDIHWSSGRLKVRGKGGRQRVVWLKDDDRDFLQGYFREFAESSSNLSSGSLLFQTGPGQKIITRFIRCMVSAAGARAGLTRDIHPHLLRHTFATDLLRETKNLPMVQKALGHADIGTTQIYTHITDDELEFAMKNLRNENLIMANSP